MEKLPVSSVSASSWSVSKASLPLAKGLTGGVWTRPWKGSSSPGVDLGVVVDLLLPGFHLGILDKAPLE